MRVDFCRIAPLDLFGNASLRSLSRFQQGSSPRAGFSKQAVPDVDSKMISTDLNAIASVGKLSDIAITVTCKDLMFFGKRSQTNQFRSISPSDASAMLHADPSIAVLDVRTAEEFESPTGHLPNARLIPVQDLESRIDELQGLKDKTILVYCRSGHRSKRASLLLSQKGFKVVELDGGFLSWLRSSLGVEK